MKNKTDFSDFSRQLPIGIIVIYGNLLFRFLKVTWIFFFIIFKDPSKLNGDRLFYISISLLLLLVFILIWAFLIFKNFLFRIHENHFELKQGVLRKTNTSIDFDRIQNVNFKQNIIQQLLNIQQVEIETAGSTKTEIIIRALHLNDARLLKEKILEKQTFQQGVIQSEKQKYFLKISGKELLKVGLTENHLMSLLLLSSLVFGLYQQIKDLFKGYIIDIEDFFKDGVNSVFNSLILFLFVIVATIAISIVTSIIRVFLFHFNLTILKNNKAFQITQGLFTVQSKLLKVNKIQSITISNNLLKRKLGISYVIFKQTVSGRVAKDKNKLVKIVGCKNNHLEKIKDFFFRINDEEFSKKLTSDIFLKRRLYFINFLIVVFLNLFLLGNFYNIKLLFINVFLIPLLFFYVQKSYTKRHYSISDNFLFIAQGVIEVNHTFLPFFKVQNIKIKQTIFQKKRNVVDLIFQTASGKIKLPCLQKKDAMSIYNYTLYKIESRQGEWI